MKRGAISITLAMALLASDAAGQEVVYSRRMGGADSDILQGVALLPDGSVVVGGTFDSKPNPTKKFQLTGGRGEVLLIPAKGEPLSLAKFDGAISDLDSDANGNVLVCGSFGSAKLDPKTMKTVWKNPLGPTDAPLSGADEGQAIRIAAGSDGGAVILAPIFLGKSKVARVHVLDADGKETSRFDVPGEFVNDVAYDPKSKLLFVCGFDNKKGKDKNGKPGPVQVAFVRAYRSDGKNVWKAYGWAGQQMFDTRLLADTRAYRIAMGADGKLYLAGETAGGNYMWGKMGDDLTANAPFETGDRFQKAFNTVAAHLLAVVRLDPETGKVERATVLLARDEKGKGSTVRPRAIAADANGNVLVAGWSAATPPKSKGSFGGEGSGAVLFTLDPNFARTLATTLAAGPSWVRGIASAGDRFALCGIASGPLATSKNDESNTNDGFVIVSEWTKKR